MLVKVLKSKLVLGRNSYKKDDVFECRDQEAVLLIAGGLLKKMPAEARATVESPQAPFTGVSVTKKPVPSPQPVAANNLNRMARRKMLTPPVRTVITDSPVKKAVDEEKDNVPTPSGNPVGAMTQPQGRFPPSANPDTQSEE